MSKIGIYGTEKKNLHRYADFAINNRSLPIVLIGPNLKVLKDVEGLIVSNHERFPGSYGQ